MQMESSLSQVLNSLAYAEMKKMNAAKLEEKRIEELKAEVRADIHSVWLIWDTLNRFGTTEFWQW